MIEISYRLVCNNCKEKMIAVYETIPSTTAEYAILRKPRKIFNRFISLLKKNNENITGEQWCVDCIKKIKEVKR